MTVVTMVWVQEHVHEVRNATKAVLSYLAFKARYDDGTAAWPAIGTIAGACGLSEKTDRTRTTELQRHQPEDRRTGQEKLPDHRMERDLQGIEPADRTMRGPVRVQGQGRHETRGKSESQNVAPEPNGPERR